MTIQFRDSDGTTRLSGDLLASGGAIGDVLTQQPDGTYAPAVGESPAVTARQALGSPSTVSIANGGNARLRWNGTSFGPNVLLDRTTDDLPSVLAAGIYCVAVTVLSEALTAGGSFEAELELDRDGVDAVIAMDSATATAGVPTPHVPLAFSWYIPASGTIAVTVRNHDGVAAVNFGLEGAQVQRIT